MINVLYGENEIEISKYIDNLQSEKNIETRISYSFKETDIENVLEEASYTDLFGNKKLIILNDCTFLTSKTTLENEDFDRYIASPNEDIILVLKIYTDKLDERKKIVKALKEKHKIIEFPKLEEKNINKYINNYFNEKNYKIDVPAINEISNRLLANTLVIDTELEKLLLYKIDTKVVTLEDVKKVVTKYTENNIFKLLDSVVKKDKKQIFKFYKSLIDEKEEPAVILVLLANQFRLMYSALVLEKEGLTSKEIASKLKEHPYRVTLALENARKTKESRLIELLINLGQVDINIKTGRIDKVKALENFFLEL